MGIAYTHRTIIKTSLRADTSANFRADVDTALTAANWSVIRSVTNGKVYETVAAPVSTLKMRLLVQDSGAGGLINFQAMNVSETALGVVHTIIVANTVTEYQAIVGCSQLFISIPGTVTTPVSGHQSSSFACGVPSLPYGTARPDCVLAGTPGIVTDIWWSCGPGDRAFFYCPDFRSSPLCFGCFSYSVNNSVTIVNPGGGTGGVSQDPTQGMLGLFFLSPTTNISFSGYVAVPMTTYAIGAPLYIDTLMGWLWAIQGQLWDSFQQSNAQPLDQISTYEDTDVYGRVFTFPAQCWMSSYYSSLRLLTESPSEGGQFAYIYGGTH